MNWLQSLISASLEKLVPLQLGHVTDASMNIVPVLARKGFSDPGWSSNWIPAGTWF